MSQDIRYYFDSPEKFPIAGFLDGLSRPCEILAKAQIGVRFSGMTPTDHISKTCFHSAAPPFRIPISS